MTNTEQAKVIRGVAERSDDITGTELVLPDGSKIWIHTAQQINDWLYGLAIAVENGEEL